MKVYFGSAGTSNYYRKDSKGNIYYYSNFLQIDIDNLLLVEDRTLIDSLNPLTISISQMLSSSSDVDVLSLINDYLISDYQFYEHSTMFFSFYTVEPLSQNSLTIPYYKADNSHFLDYAQFKSSLLKFDSVNLPVECSIYGAPSDFNLELAFVTFHRIATTEDYFIVIYFPADYEYSQTSGLTVGTPLPISGVVYRYHVYNIKKKLTTCCLKQCFSPTKYIFYKG